MNVVRHKLFKVSIVVLIQRNIRWSKLRWMWIIEFKFGDVIFVGKYRIVEFKMRFLYPFICFSRSKKNVKGKGTKNCWNESKSFMAQVSFHRDIRRRRRRRHSIYMILSEQWNNENFENSLSPSKKSISFIPSGGEEKSTLLCSVWFIQLRN